MEGERKKEEDSARLKLQSCCQFLKRSHGTSMPKDKEGQRHTNKAIF